MIGNGRVSVRDRRAQLSGSLCSVLLALVICASAATGLRLTRGATLGADEYLYFVVDRGFDLKGLLSPHNGNLIAVIRLLYAAVFKLFGPDYLVFRLLEVVGVAVVAILFYAFVRRRIGPAAALLFTLPLLFFGAAPDVTLSPNGLTHVVCIAVGLAAMLALGADTRWGDRAACGLLVLAVGTFSIGLAFLAGIAVAVLVRHDRRKRAWIFVLPLAAYLAWKVAAPVYHGPGYLSGAHVSAENVLTIPRFVAESATAVAAAVSGLPWYAGEPSPTAGVLSGYAYGLVAAVPAVAWLVARVLRGEMRHRVWPLLAILLAFWISIVMVIGFNRYPNSTRYLYAGAVGALLVLSESFRGVRLRGPAAIALVVVTAVSLIANVAWLRNDSVGLRSESARLKAIFTAIDLAREHVSPGYLPADAFSAAVLIKVGGGVDAYRRAVERSGSPSFTAREILSQPEPVRILTDATVLRALPATLAPAHPKRSQCSGAAHPRPQPVIVRPPGLVFAAERSGQVVLGRFAFPQTVLGSIDARRYYQLGLPRDRSSLPWRALLPSGPLLLCRA